MSWTDRTPFIEWSDPQRDKYGRTVRYLHLIIPTTDTRKGGRETLCALTRLPKCYIEVHGKSESYMVTNWTMGYVADPGFPGKLVRTATLKDAKAIGEQIAEHAVAFRTLSTLGKAA